MRREAARFRPPRELLAGQFVFRAGAIKRAQFFAAEFQGDFNRRAAGGVRLAGIGGSFSGGLGLLLHRRSGFGQAASQRKMRAV
jgi:hypothetical protein